YEAQGDEGLVSGSHASAVPHGVSCSTTRKPQTRRSRSSLGQCATMSTSSPLRRPCADVAAVDQDHVAGAIDAAVAVAETVGGGVELLIARQQIVTHGLSVSAQARRSAQDCGSIFPP